MTALEAVRARLALRRCAAIGAGVEVRGRIWIHGDGAVRVGNRVRLDAGAAPIELHAFAGGEIVLEDGAVVEGGASLEARRSIVVGARARVGPSCKIIDSHFHRVDDRDAAPAAAAVVVEPDARLGAGCIVLAGARVRQGATVREGAVVRGPPLAAQPASDRSAPPRPGAVARAAHQVRLAAAAARGALEFRRARCDGRVYAFGPVRLSGDERLRIGDRAIFVGGMIPTRLVAHEGAVVSIGERSILNYGVAIEARLGVRIGRRCMLASGVRLSDAGPDGRPAAITIGDGVWLAHGVVVAPGVTIGEGSVVSAGSVVTRDVPPRSLAAGNPARCMSLALAAAAPRPAGSAPGALPARSGAAADDAGDALARPLGAVEALFHAFNSAGAYLVGAVAEVEGPLDADLLPRALAHVQRRWPYLGARILDGPDGPRFAPAEAPVALRVVGPGEPDGAAELLAEQLQLPYAAASGPLWRCAFAPAAAPEGRHRLALGVDHAVADGLSVYRLLADLVETCAALHEGRAPPPPLPPAAPIDGAMPRPSAAASLLRRARRARLWLAPTPLEIVPPLARAGPDARRSRVLVRATEPDVLARLEARCRGERATIEGALAAALVHALEPLSPARPWIPVGHQVSLRRLARPPIAADAVGCYVAGTYTAHALGAGRPFWEVARAATRQLRRVVDSGAIGGVVHGARGWLSGAAAFVAARARDPRTLGRAGVVGISNLGRLPPVQSGPFAVHAFHVGAGTHVVGDVFQLTCATLDGRLLSALGWVEPLVDAATAEAFLDRALQRLASASEA